MTLNVKFQVLMNWEHTIRIPIHEEETLREIKKRVFDIYNNTMGHPSHLIGKQLHLKDINDKEIVNDRHFEKAFPHGLFGDFY